MQYSTIVLAAFTAFVAASPAPSPVIDVARAEPTACAPENSFRCFNNNPQVCGQGIWQLAAKCASNQKCVLFQGSPFCIDK
jgi:hypothetical protein